RSSSPASTPARSALQLARCARFHLSERVPRTARSAPGTRVAPCDFLGLSPSTRCAARGERAHGYEGRRGGTAHLGGRICMQSQPCCACDPAGRKHPVPPAPVGPLERLQAGTCSPRARSNAREESVRQGLPHPPWSFRVTRGVRFLGL